MTHQRPGRTALIALAALSLAGCDWFGGAGSSADTTMKNVEILPGTASDEMITLDSASGDGTAIDTSVDVVAGQAGDAERGTDAAGDAEEASETGPDTPVAGEEPQAGADDVVIRPPEPATK